MDTSTVEGRADTLGRRVVPRQFRSLEDKLRIIDEARVPGASVASVARRHGVNANLVFAWMRLQGQGLLAARTRRSTPALLAVTVEPAVPTEAAAVEPAPQALPAVDHIEVLLPDGTRVRAFGAGSSEGLERVLRLLRR
jgi:transposase-like protein